MPLGAIGTVPNNSVAQGEIKLGAIQGVTTSAWNPRSGGTSRTVYKGTQSIITILAQEAKAAGLEYTIQGGHVWTLEVSYPWDVIVDQVESQSNPLFTWELLNQPFERDLMELNERPFIGTLSNATKEQIEDKLKNPVDKTKTPFAPQDMGTIDVMVNATVAYNLKRIGVRGRQNIVQSLKRTLIVGNNYNISSITLQPSFDYKLFTKAQLLSIYNSDPNPLNRIPMVIENAMPNTLTLQEANGPTSVGVREVSGYSMDRNGINTFVGWLQFPPEYHMVATNKVAITQFWTFNQWSAGKWGLYDTYDGSSGDNPDNVFQLAGA